MKTDAPHPLLTDTICAIATPAGGALGIVRVAGPEAIAATERILRPKGKKALSEKPGGTLTFGTIVDPEHADEPVDEVLVSLMRAPHSYTGDDCVELSCHGSAYILQRVVRLLLRGGCRTAEAGEFTKRAFVNGKMDLSQAEAVADLIASTTRANHRIAMQQMRGGISTHLHTLHDQLLHLTSLLELELDFSDHEDLEFADRSELLDLSTQIADHISSLCQTFRLGNALKRGIPVAIVGETNAGKSTLLNALLGEERALVSDIHGTTRDTIEECITIDDALVRLIDTAGLRHTSDRVEQMGIERSHAKMREADIILWLIDAADAARQFDALAPALLPLAEEHKRLLLVVNKADTIPSAAALGAINAQLRSAVDAALADRCKALNTDDAHRPSLHLLPPLSVQTPDGLAQVRTALSAAVHSLLAAAPQSDTLISNLRHYEALRAAHTAILRAADGLRSGLSGDFVSQDLRECLHHLAEIVGEVSTDEVLGNIFRHFCVGK